MDMLIHPKLIFLWPVLPENNQVSQYLHTDNSVDCSRLYQGIFYAWINSLLILTMCENSTKLFKFIITFTIVLHIFHMYRHAYIMPK